MQNADNASEKVWTIAEILKWTQNYFQSYEIDSPQLEAQLLLAHALSMTRIELIMYADKPLNAEERARFRALIIKRREHVPLAYILGKREFWSLELDVSPAVLIPRADTECLVERALRFLRSKASTLPCHDAPELSLRQAYYAEILKREAAEKAALLELARVESGEPLPRPQAPTQNQNEMSLSELSPRERPSKGLIIDVGTGSGAIALALRKELSPEDYEILAIDISPTALALAKQNAHKLKLTQGLDFQEGDLLKAFEGQADLIVSNPPYLSFDDYEALEPELFQEPSLALKGGHDGLDIYRALIPQAFAKLKPSGALIVEIGFRQAKDVQTLFQEAGFIELSLQLDYAKLPRVLFGRKA